jgi:hypothetical protein
MPLTSDSFEKILNGTLSDGDIRLGDLEDYDMPGDYYLYFLCVATDSKHRVLGFKSLYVLSCCIYLSSLRGLFCPEIERERIYARR